MKHLNQNVLGFVISFVLATAAQGADGFTATGSLDTARYRHTATLLPSGKVVVAGGESYSIDDSGNIESLFFTSAELYDPATGTWTPAGSLGNARASHTATLLPNGKVLVAGGFIVVGWYTIPLASAELYDPATGTWTPTSSLGTARAGHTATLLPTGKVLVVGGGANSAELYNPATGKWSLTGSLANPSDGGTATLLPNGKVLVAGSGAELYNPATGTWTTTGSLVTARLSHTATLLPNGKVLVAGGERSFYDGSSTITFISAELYDPAAGTWTPTGSLVTARASHTATLLSNGKVLIAGGYNYAESSLFASAELYDPATGTWSATGSLSFERYSHTATLLPNGKALFAGGLGFLGSLSTSSELYESFLNPILNPIKLGDGSFQFNFSNPSGSYRVLASPNAAAPLNTWSNLGPATETQPGSGQFQFTDHQATSYPHRFYRVTSP